MKKVLALFFRNLWKTIKDSTALVWMMIATIIVMALGTMYLWFAATVSIFWEFGTRYEDLWVGAYYAIAFNLILLVVGWLVVMIGKAIIRTWKDYHDVP